MVRSSRHFLWMHFEKTASSYPRWAEQNASKTGDQLKFVKFWRKMKLLQAVSNQSISVSKKSIGQNSLWNKILRGRSIGFIMSLYLQVPKNFVHHATAIYIRKGVLKRSSMKYILIIFAKLTWRAKSHCRSLLRNCIFVPNPSTIKCLFEVKNEVLLRIKIF